MSWICQRKKRRIRVACPKCEAFKKRIEFYDSAVKTNNPKIITKFTCDSCRDAFSINCFPETLQAFEKAGQMSELPRADMGFVPKK